MSRLRYTRDEADGQEILRHLRACDTAFFPPLSDRVTLADYADKIVRHACRFEAWHGSDLVGLVAAYVSEPETTANTEMFITNVSVDGEYRGQGVARHLMRLAILEARTRAVARMRLMVDDRAKSACALYTSLGFLPTGSRSDTLEFELSLENAHD